LDGVINQLITGGPHLVRVLGSAKYHKLIRLGHLKAILIGSLTLPGRSLAGHLCSNRQRRHPRVTLGRAGSLAATCVVPFGHRLEGNPMETHHRQMIFHDYPIQNLHLLGLCRRASLESRCSSDHPEASSMTWVQKLPQESRDL